ncbi:hypothetical protein DB346_06490 [Verrucomicrobia bacterium LW23]|nr:hypothetical protein DB346_06490 [Verrucomicrobia bacterium LW23]
MWRRYGIRAMGAAALIALAPGSLLVATEGDREKDKDRDKPRDSAPATPASGDREKDRAREKELDANRVKEKDRNRERDKEREGGGPGSDKDRPHGGGGMRPDRPMGGGGMGGGRRDGDDDKRGGPGGGMQNAEESRRWRRESTESMDILLGFRVPRRRELDMRDHFLRLSRLSNDEIREQLNRWPPYKKMSLGDQGRLMVRIQEIKDRKRDIALFRARDFNLTLRPDQEQAFENAYWDKRLAMDRKLFQELEPRRRELEDQMRADLIAQFSNPAARESEPPARPGPGAPPPPPASPPQAQGQGHKPGPVPAPATAGATNSP